MTSQTLLSFREKKQLKSGTIDLSLIGQNEGDLLQWNGSSWTGLSIADVLNLIGTQTPPVGDTTYVTQLIYNSTTQEYSIVNAETNFDVTETGNSNGDILLWNSTTGMWENMGLSLVNDNSSRPLLQWDGVSSWTLKTAAEISSDVTFGVQLEDLNNVVTTNTQQDQVLGYNFASSTWVNVDPVIQNAFVPTEGISTINLGDLNNVTIGAALLNDVLMFDGANWVPSSVNYLLNNALGGGSNNGDILQWNGSAWVANGQSVSDLNVMQYSTSNNYWVPTSVSDLISGATLDSITANNLSVTSNITYPDSYLYSFPYSLPYQWAVTSSEPTYLRLATTGDTAGPVVDTTQYFKRNPDGVWDCKLVLPVFIETSFINTATDSSTLYIFGPWNVVDSGEPRWNIVGDAFIEPYIYLSYPNPTYLVSDIFKVRVNNLMFTPSGLSIVGPSDRIKVLFQKPTLTLDIKNDILSQPVNTRIVQLHVSVRIFPGVYNSTLTGYETTGNRLY